MTKNLVYQAPGVPVDKLTSPSQGIAGYYEMDDENDLSMMTMRTYGRRALSTAMYPGVGQGYVSTYPMAKLAGEVGEFCEKIGKRSRTDQTLVVHRDDFTKAEVTGLLLELGDILWYVNALSKELGSSLDEVANLNLKKLADRKARGVIDGAGDNR
jgi:NTP pyrophosphatase (non-canonical NTP hydrolase)